MSDAGPPQVARPPAGGDGAQRRIGGGHASDAGPPQVARPPAGGDGAQRRIGGEHVSDTPAPSARLAYEPLDVAHTPSLAAWADPQLYRWIGDAPTPAQVVARISRITTRPPPPGERWRNWVARRRDDGTYVGVVEATVYDTPEDDAPLPPCRAPSPPGGEGRVRGAQAHLGYFIFAAFQRQGYAHEACAAVISHLRAHYGVDTIVASVDTRNEPSQRLAESLGFVREEGRFPADPIGGEPAWDFRYRLLLPG